MGKVTFLNAPRGPVGAWPERPADVIRHPMANAYGFQPVDAEPVPEIIVSAGQATWITDCGPIRITDPRVLGDLGSLYAENGYVRAANRFWDAELELSAPMGAA
jgi:hypothetical protein